MVLIKYVFNIVQYSFIKDVTVIWQVTQTTGPHWRWGPVAGCGDSSPWRGCGLRIWPHVGTSQPSRSVRMQSCSGWSQELHCKVVTPCWRWGWPAFWVNVTGRKAPASTYGEDQGGVKEPCLTLSSLLSYILMSLFHFVLPVASCCCWFVVGGCMGIENSHIKEGAASALVPELLGLNVQPCLVLNVRASQGKPLPSQRLEGWFNGQIRVITTQLHNKCQWLQRRNTHSKRRPSSMLKT